MTGQTPDKAGHVRRCPPAQMGDQTGQTWTNPFRGCPVVRSSHDPKASKGETACGNLGKAGNRTGPNWISASGGRGAPTFSPPQNFWKSGSGSPKAVKLVKSGERAWKN